MINYRDGTLNLLDARSGAVRRTVHVGPHPLSVAVDSAAHRAYVVNRGDGTVTFLDTRTGAVARTVSAGAGARAAVVAARAGRVLVVNQDEDTVSILDAVTDRERYWPMLRRDAS